MEDVLAVATRALDALGGAGQAIVVAERRLGPAGAQTALSVVVTAVVDGRCASGRATAADPDALARAAKHATVQARRMRALRAPELPGPAPVAAHAGADPALETIDPAALDAAVRAAAGDRVALDWSGGAARIAVASSTGIAVTEARTWLTVVAEAGAADGRTARVTRTGAGLGEAGGGEKPDGGAVPVHPARAGRAAPAEARGRVGGGAAGATAAEARGHVGGGAAGATAAEARGRVGGGAVGATAAEARGHVGGGAPDAATAAALARVDAAEAVAEALGRVVGGTAGPAPDGPVRAVLGPEAVAAVLDAVRASFGVGAALGDVAPGARLGAAGVHLADDAGLPHLPRAFDAEGVPRRAVVLLEDGLVAGTVRDSATGASTGHATMPLTPAPMPEHLVLAPGDAPDEAALAEALGDGLLLPALRPTGEPGEHGGRVLAAPGAALVRGGRVAGGLAGLHVEVDAAAVLGGVVALGRPARPVALRGHCPGGIGVAVVPALLTTAGVRVARVDAP